MKATSLPNLNHEPTSYHNFFTFIQDPNHHDDTTLHKERPNIDHSQVTEPSETSPFNDILSPFVSFNGSNQNHYPVGGNFYKWDQNQMDQTLPRLPPSPTRSYDTTASVGSNPFSGNVGARSEGPNFTQLRWDQTLPNTSSVGSAQLSGNVGARSEGPNVTQLQGDQTVPSMSSVGSKKTTQTWATTTSNLVDDGYAWSKYGQKHILGATHPRSYFKCTHRGDQDSGMLLCKECTAAAAQGQNDAEYFHNQHELKPSLNHNQSTPPTDPSFQLPDSMVFDSSVPMPALSRGSDHGDLISSSGVYSCTSSTHDNSFDDLEALMHFDVSQLEFCY